MSSINNAGFAKYVIELDVIGIEKAKMLETQLKSTSVSLTNMAKGPLGNVNTSFKQLTGTVEGGVTPLGNFNKQMGAMPSTWDKTSSAMNKAEKSTMGFARRLGEGMRANKGMVFGLAGLSSAAAEGAGMLGMYGDAVEQNREAQEKLAEVQADSTSSTQDLARAEQDAAKAKKWLSMSTRNLVLSQMDQVFFGTMVISQLSEMSTKGGLLSKVFGKVGSVVKGTSSSVKILTGGITAGADALGTFAPKASGLKAGLLALAGASDVASLSIRGIGLAIATIAAPLATLKAGLDIIPKVQEAIDRQSKIKDPRTTNIERWKLEIADIDHKLQAFDITNFDTWATGIASAWATVSGGMTPEDLKQKKAQLEELIKLYEDVPEVANQSLIGGSSYNLQASKDAQATIGFTNKIKQSVELNNKVMAAGRQEFIQYIANGKAMGFTYEELSGALDGYIAKNILQVDSEGEVTKASEAKAQAMMTVADEIFPKLLQAQEKQLISGAELQLQMKTFTTEGAANYAKLSGEAGAMAARYVSDADKMGATTEVAAAGVDDFAKVLLDEGYSIQFVSLVSQKLNNHYANQGTTLEQVTAMHERAIAAKELQAQKDQEAIAIEDEYIQKLKDGKDMMAQNTEEGKEYIRQLEALNTIGFSQIEVMRMDEETRSQLSDLVLQQTEAYKAEEQALGETAAKYGLLNKEMLNAIANGEDNTSAIRMQIIAGLDWAKALTDATERTKQLEIGTLAGYDSLAQFTSGLVSGFAESTTFRTGLEAIVKAMHPGINTTVMYTDELQRLAEEGFMNAADKALMFKERLKEGIEESKSVFSDIIGADDKDSFKDAWKDIKDIFPKSLRDDAKDIFEDWRKGAQDVEEVAKGFDFVNAALSEMSDSEADKFTKDLFKELDKVKDQDTINALAGYPSMFKDIEENAVKLPQSFNELTKAMDDGKISGSELNLILAAYRRETGLAVDPTTQLSEEQQKIANNNILARTIDQVTTNISIQARAVNQLNTNYQTLSGTYTKIFGGGGVLPEFPDGSKPGDNPLNPRDKSGGGGGGRGYEILTIFQGQEMNTIFDKLAIFGEGLIKVTVKAQELQTGLANLAIQGSNSMTILGEQSSTQMSGIENNFSVGEVASQHLQTGIANLANEGSNSLSMLANSSSDNMNGMENNLNTGYESAGHLQTGLANLANEGSDSLSALAKSSSKNMNGLINNMEAGEKAVKSLKSAIDSLKDKTVTVKYRQEGAPQSQGGVYSFAEGGTVSAAGGLTTVSQPTHFIYGDNPGNHETLAFIPHNNPGPIMDKLEKMFGSNGKGGSQFLQNITLNVKGSDLVNSMKIDRKIRTTIGDKRDRFG